MAGLIGVSRAKRYGFVEFESRECLTSRQAVDTVWQRFNQATDLIGRRSFTWPMLDVSQRVELEVFRPQRSRIEEPVKVWVGAGKSGGFATDLWRTVGFVWSGSFPANLKGKQCWSEIVHTTARRCHCSIERTTLGFVLDDYCWGGVGYFSLISMYVLVPYFGAVADSKV